VLWAYDMFSAKQFLALTGPTTAKLNKPFKVKVTDVKNGGKAVKGATVSRVAKTDAKGVATVVGTAKGQLLIKAERKGAVRSNALVVRVR
jgi:uncharacterized GH25 family protein